LTLKIKKITRKAAVYDITVEDNENFFANEILVHNCTEVMQNTVPMKSLDDTDARISLCTLSAVNYGIIKTKEDLIKYVKLAGYALDELISYQDYIIEAAREGTIDFRSIGVGITNFAYWMAKQGFKYQDATPECLDTVDQWMEAHAYGAIEGSIERAEKWGPCRRVEDTLYKQGMMPQDVRKKAVDELTPFVERLDWNKNRERAKISGVRNNPNMCQMPTESSSQTSNSTNGFEPARGIISSKKSKDGILTQVVPESRKLKNAYDLLWDQKSPEGYLKIAAVIQKWMDSGMSVNTSYNPAFYPDGKLPMSVMVKDVVNHYRWGGKSLYYLNTNDNSGEKDNEAIFILEDAEKDCCSV